MDVEALKIDETDLNTKRMLDLMAVSHDEGAMPLYLHTVTRILRQMRMKQQELDIPFSYTEFKTLLDNAGLLGTQVGPLEQRLQTLESFLYSSGPSKTENKKKSRQGRGTDWSSKVLKNLIVYAPSNKATVWSIDHCGLVLPMRHSYNGVLAVQYSFESISRAEHGKRQSRCPR